MLRRINRFRNEYIKLCEELSAILNNIKIDKPKKEKLNQILNEEFLMVQTLWNEVKETLDEERKMNLESAKEHLTEKEVNDLLNNRKKIDKIYGFDFYEIN